MQPRTLPTEPPFDPTRYQILRELGSGAAGTVYLVLDRETSEQLALKKLTRIDQRSVLRFKREFRSLANLHHTNLIRLYDLGRGTDAWFLTMEYVEGRNLGEELQRAQSVHEVRDHRHASANDQAVDVAHFTHVTDLFQQLAAGVRAVHQAGMLHRDLKPSNVVVASNGRVVVLDFGLVHELEQDRDEVRLTHDGAIAGTPAYMSPEQATAQPLTEASDWYSFGVMLYQMLCGRLPIDGRNAVDLIQRKLQMAPEPLLEDTDGPRSLRALCMALLEREPAARPSGEQVVATLAALRPETIVRTYTQSEELLPQTDAGLGLSSAPLFGRDRELAQLRAALDRAARNEPVIAHVRGTSGAGKSALVERFLDEPELTRRSNLLVLRSRCYEREAMPFKALDGVMDALVDDLLQLDDFDVAHVLPHDVGELTQVFPVFERLPAMRKLTAGRKPGGEAAETRRRAENSLSQLIDRLATRRTVVIWIDDLQWGDLDSASVIKNWLSRRDGPPLLWIFSYRSDEVETSPCLRILLEPEASATASKVVLDVTPLADAEVRELCSQRLTQSPSVPPHLIDRIVDEARGNPFLAQQLVALAIAKHSRGDADLNTLSVEELVVRTSSLLEPEARALLNVLAIAGRPIAPYLALSAADVHREGRNHIHALQALRLVRTRAVGGQRWLEVYHDRVREGVNASLSAAEREREHARLLRVLETVGVADPDWLHELALGANHSASALRYGLLAAERANATLAFERAAELYARCVELNERPADSADLWIKLAMTLARCRRGPKAADAYLRAAEHVAPDAQPPLLRLAASHLLRSGRYEEGERLIRRVLELLELDVPETELGLMAAIGWERMRIAMRGYAVKPHASAETSARLRRTAELYGTLTVDTQLYEPLRAALFQARCLRLALESGDAIIIARALVLAAAVACASGTARAERQSAELLERAEGLARELDSEDLAVELPSTRALCAMFLGRPLEVLEHAAAAERAYAPQSLGGGHGDYFYMFAVHTVRMGALVALARYTAVREELTDFLARAHATDNRTAILQASLIRTFAERTVDNCKSSRARLDAERLQLPASVSFSVQRLSHMIATMQAACATGDYAWAQAALAEDWPAYLRATVHGTAYLACIAHSYHARLLLNQHVASGQTADLARMLQPDLRALARLPATALRDGMIVRVRARCAYLSGDTPRAIELLRRSVKSYKDALCLDESERDQLALGYLIGGAEKPGLCAAAIAALRERGVCDPVEELRGYYPELFRDAG